MSSDSPNTAERERAMMIKRISVTSLMNNSNSPPSSRAGSGLARSQSTKMSGSGSTPRRPTILPTTIVAGKVDALSSPSSGSDSASDAGKSKMPYKRTVGFSQLQQALKKLKKTPSTSNITVISASAASGASSSPPGASGKTTVRKQPRRARRARSVRSREKAILATASVWAPAGAADLSEADALLLSTRQRHTISCTKNFVVIYGGCTNKGTAPPSEILTYSLKTKKWSTPSPVHVSQSERYRSATLVRFRGGANAKHQANIPTGPPTSMPPPIPKSDSAVDEKRDAFAAKKSMSDQNIADPATAPGSPGARRTSILMKTPSDPRIRGHSMDVRYSHSAVVHMGSVFLFAGTSLRTGQLTNSIIRYDPEQQEWDSVDPIGTDIPPKRRGHAAVVIQNSMYIFGGLNEQDKPLQDIWRYNFDSHQWHEITPNGELPVARYHHSAVASYNRMFVFGGFDGSKELNDFYSFNPGTNSWQLELPRRQCTPPPAKQGHSLNAIGSNIYLVGGNASNEDKLDIHIYNIEKQVWSQIAYDYSPGREKAAPEKHNRRFHAAVVNINTRSHQLLLFGGTNAQNSDRLEQLSFVTDTLNPLEQTSDTSAYNSLPQKEWEAIAMSLHPDILTLRERLRAASQLTSYGRQGLNLQYRTQVKESLSAQSVLQMIMEWLASKGYNTTLAKLQQDTGEQYVKPFNTQQTALESLLSLCKRRLPSNANIWSPQILNLKEERMHENVDHLPSYYVDEESEVLKQDVWDEDVVPNQNLRIEGMLVYAGTLNVLLHMLVDYGAFVNMAEEDDGRFYEEFRLCFFWMLHSFTSPEVLLKKMIQLYEVPDELEELNIREHQGTVLGLLRFWVETCKWDWTREKLQEQAVRFMENSIATSGQLLESRELRQAIMMIGKDASAEAAADDKQTPRPSADETSSSLESSSTGHSPSERRNRTISVAVGRAMREQSETVNLEQPAPEPIVPKNIFSPKLSLDEVSEVEIARQLTIVQSAIFGRVTPPELCKKWWTSDEAETRAPNVKMALRHFERVQRWCLWQVVKQDNTKSRQQAYNRMIKIAETLRALNNFETLFAFHNALNEKVLVPFQSPNRRFLDACAKLREEKAQGDDSYGSIISRCEATREPCIPFFKLTLDSIERWEDMLPDTDSLGRINFHKRRLLWQCICDIVPFQKMTYNLLPIYQIAALLRFPDLPSAEEVSILAIRSTS